MTGIKQRGIFRNQNPLQNALRSLYSRSCLFLVIERTFKKYIRWSIIPNRIMMSYLAPSLHREFSMRIIQLNVKMAPDIIYLLHYRYKIGLRRPRVHSLITNSRVWWNQKRHGWISYIHFNELHWMDLTSLLQGSQNNFLENSIDFSSRVIIICGST